MATYVFSDVHGHRATLDRLLERVSPASDDHIFMLGDMIDRGPDPVGVVRTCQELEGAVCLKGNHEDLMLAYLDDDDDDDGVNRFNWEINGGATTAEGLGALPVHERLDLIDWISQLPVYAHAIVGERPYIFVHAGIVAEGLAPRESWTDDDLEELLAAQDGDDLMWVREDFWGRPTGLLDGEGKGPIVVAGHTPTPYLETMADKPDRLAVGEDGLARMVRVGACAETGGVADRWDIDCGCAGGPGYGKLLILRLDDGEEFYEPVREGE